MNTSRHSKIYLFFFLLAGSLPITVNASFGSTALRFLQRAGRNSVPLATGLCAIYKINQFFAKSKNEKPGYSPLSVEEKTKVAAEFAGITGTEGIADRIRVASGADLESGALADGELIYIGQKTCESLVSPDISTNKEAARTIVLHELGHIQHGDTKTSLLHCNLIRWYVPFFASCLINFCTSRWRYRIPLYLGALCAGTWIWRALSCRAEFAADLYAAERVGGAVAADAIRPVLSAIWHMRGVEDSFENPPSLWSRLVVLWKRPSHPHPYDRVQALKKIVPLPPA